METDKLTKNEKKRYTTLKKMVKDISKSYKIALDELQKIEEEIKDEPRLIPSPANGFVLNPKWKNYNDLSKSYLAIQKQKVAIEKELFEFEQLMSKDNDNDEDEITAFLNRKRGNFNSANL